MQVVVDLPESLLSRFEAGADISLMVREALIVDGYLAGQLTRGQIGELLGMNFYEVEEWFARKGIPRNYSVADLDDDRKTFEKILPVR